jgi:Insulin-induced protein (INSIG)
MSDTPQVLRPIPRRNFEITPASNESSVPPSPAPETTNPDLLDPKSIGTSPSRTRSILNLTSSTLLGIYSPTGYEVSREEPSTPWGTGAQTPSHRQSVGGQSPPLVALSWNNALPRAAFDRRRRGNRGLYFPLLLRGTLLFVIGIAYGTLVTHLHDNQQLAPVKVEAFDRHSWSYTIFWGLAGVALGTLLPLVDSIWSEAGGLTERSGSPVRRRGSSSSVDGEETGERSGFAADWTPVVRSVGAFIGIAFAIVSISNSFHCLSTANQEMKRKLPWQSTLQVSLTLALVNPVLWYLVDRSKPGFVFSAVVGVVGTFALLEINPDILPSPARQAPKRASANITSQEEGFSSFVSQESIGIWTWIASVLFCSCVCFGNIGRRLALGHQSAIS